MKKQYKAVFSAAAIAAAAVITGSASLLSRRHRLRPFSVIRRALRAVVWLRQGSRCNL